MGIPGILKEIGPGERVALSKLAIEHFERNNRPLRIAIDASIWNFQCLKAQGGKNPALRTLFYRLLKFLALPIQPVFVYDGKNKPLTKRGKTVARYGGTCVPNERSKELVRKFSYPWHVAPGEAEAECALLQRKGIVDAVMSQDADAIMFGSKVTFRNWSKEGTRGNKGPTHVNVLESQKVKESYGLDTDGMVLVALLSGGDYDEAGLPGFGSAIACEVARAGFGQDLLELIKEDNKSGIGEWRERLEYELSTNTSGFFKQRHTTLKIPEAFPDMKILNHYRKPAISEEAHLSNLQTEWKKVWNTEIDIPDLREYTASMLDWRYRSGARRFVRCLAEPLFRHRLWNGTVMSANFSTDSITERRQHYINDGIPELRIAVVPTNVVGIDLESEEQNPDYINDQMEDDDENMQVPFESSGTTAVAEESLPGSNSPSKKRRSPPWDPYTLEKWWVPETLMQLGLSEIVESWHQLQRDILADPKKFATRKATRQPKVVKQIDTTMQNGAIRGFFTQVNRTTGSRGQTKTVNTTTLTKEIHTTTQSAATPPKSRSTNVEHAPSQSLNRFFKAQKDTQNQPDRIDNACNSSQTVADDASTGGSFSAAISIDSSPPSISIDLANLGPYESDLIQVTQRKQRRIKNKLEKISSGITSSQDHRPRPIESFFTSSQSACLPDNGIGGGTAHVGRTEVSPTPEPLSYPMKNVKSSAHARDSLPGAWKESSPGRNSSKRIPRISYVDLTSD